jgi:hypothetical protein
MKTFMSRSLTLPRKQAAKFDLVKTEDLDLRQNAVHGRPIQKTREQCVASLTLCDHGRKGRQRRWTEMAGDPKCVPIRCLVHTPIISARQVRSHHQDLVSRRLVFCPVGNRAHDAGDELHLLYKKQPGREHTTENRQDYRRHKPVKATTPFNSQRTRDVTIRLGERPCSIRDR